MSDPTAVAASPPLVVYGTFGAWGMPTVSPFVLKLLTWLRMAGLPHEYRGGNPFRAPKGKVPYIELDGRKMGDSQLIIEALSARHDIRLDDHLTPEKRATGHALRRMMEEATYFHSVRFRWLEEDGWPAQVAAFSPHMPPLVGPLLLRRIRSQLRKANWLQGSGRHDRGTASAQVIADVAAVRDLLVGPYLFGEEPSSFDATVSSFLWQLQDYPVDTPQKQAASDQKLLSYVDGMRRRYYPELSSRSSSPPSEIASTP